MDASPSPGSLPDLAHCNYGVVVVTRNSGWRQGMEPAANRSCGRYHFREIGLDHHHG